MMVQFFLMLKTIHIISVVCWFAGLFYLPRLMVYHTENPTIHLFCTMERRLYYGIMWPSAIFTTVSGLLLFSLNYSGYMASFWMQAKLAFVVFLWLFHGLCAYFVKELKNKNFSRSSKFFRLFNEVPTVLLILIVALVVIKPFF